ncbi:MAG: YceD family protein [candidate division WOR-3 bacterium]|nr:YceD family protein [candidate division WOR-3 bacterium]MCX7757492.1 YceD family protein [candidate division WOR-3 bacterium]MDW7987129.1 DUF177 domain-containing protein [candidate division WOR-3 bacterium]
MVTVKKSKLLINVNAVPNGVTKISKELDANDLDLGHLEFCSPIKVDLELTKNANNVRVTGTVDFCLKLICVNCLEEFERQFSEKVYQEYIRVAAKKIPFVEQLEEVDFIREYYSQDFFDLSPLIHDIIILAIPLAPWCRVDCKGIE